jgi:hypothetical protein
MGRVFIIFGFLMYSCGALNKVPEVSLNGKYVSLDKVKVRISSGNFGNIALKGYISVVHDSLLCFNFNGPLGFKVLSGKFGEQFVVKDYYNDRLYNDVLKELILKSGIIFNKACIENVILSQVDSLSLQLKKLNASAIEVKTEDLGKKSTLTLLNPVKSNLFKFEFFLKKKMPREINIFYKGSNDEWEVKIEVISLSNLKKKCNFGF